MVEVSEKTRILLVEDEESIQDFITMALNFEGFEVILASTGAEALGAFRDQAPRLIILDWMLPEGDGLSVCREIRQASSVPILMLTARSQLEDKVLGLDSGADDFLAKPFKIQELLARIRALLRRSGADPGNVLRFGELSLNLATRRLTRGDALIEATGREFDLMELLLRHPHQVLTREQILTRLWGWDYDGNANVVEVHISSLRQKLGDHDRKLIRTVRGVGYGLGG